MLLAAPLSVQREAVRRARQECAAWRRKACHRLLADLPPLPPLPPLVLPRASTAANTQDGSPAHAATPAPAAEQAQRRVEQIALDVALARASHAVLRMRPEPQPHGGSALRAQAAAVRAAAWRLAAEHAEACDAATQALQQVRGCADGPAGTMHPGGGREKRRL